MTPPLCEPFFGKKRHGSRHDDLVSTFCLTQLTPLELGDLFWELKFKPLILFPILPLTL